jgi:thiol-disulfide isomerase/thioredoxin
MFRRRSSGPGSLRWQMSALAVAIAISAVFLWFDTQNAGPPEFRGAVQKFQPKSPAATLPDLHFADADGQVKRLADFRGRVLVLNYWATWCAPCVEEMPSLSRLQAKLGGDRFAVLAVSVDREGLPVVVPFLEKLAIKNLAVYTDRTGATMRALGVRGLPTTMIIDGEGREAGRIEGMANWDSPEAEALVRYYMAVLR